MHKIYLYNIIHGVHKTNYEIIFDRKEAINKGLEMLNKNDTLLILGKGLDNYMAIDDKYIKYSDLNVIKSYFKKLSKEK